MPGRTFNGGYRFGFNGKEQDPEASGQGNQYDYGFRIYNPRIGKFLSVDPLTQKYPWNSPFSFAENDIIRNVDLDGREKHPYANLPQWAQNGMHIMDGTAKGLHKLAHDFALIRPADDNDPKTLSESWDRIKQIPSNVASLPANLKEVYTNGSLEEKAEATVGLIGTIAALKSGKSSGTLINVVQTGYNSESRIVTFINRVKNIKNEVKVPKDFEKVTVEGSKADVFKLKGKNEWITPDLDSHIGGIWKKAVGKAENLFKKETREGTFNADLSKRIGK